MATESNSDFIGKVVSLISTARIRYEGTIFAIDNNKITLKNVRIFGTEDRQCDIFIDMIKDMKSIISFNRTGIRSINIIPQYSFYDPSIVDQSVNDASSNISTEYLNNSEGSYRNRNHRQERRDNYRNHYNSVDMMEQAVEEPVTNDFDFEESNKKFENDDEPIDVTSGPAYKKTDFFDNLEDHSLGMRYRSMDAETFGKRSLDDRNREYRQNNYTPNRNNRNNRNNQHGQSWYQRDGDDQNGGNRQYNGFKPSNSNNIFDQY